MEPLAKELRANCSAFSLIEAAVATSILALFLSTLMLMSSNVLGLLRTAKDNVSASQALQERLEEMRIANWVQITDASYIANNLYNTGSPSASTLAVTVETITVSAYPPKAGFASAKVVRQNNAAQVATSNAGLKDERVVRVDVTLTWQGFPKKRQRVRAATTLVAKGGITK